MSRKNSVDVPCVRCGTFVSRQPNAIRRAARIYCSHACHSADIRQKPDGERFWSKVQKGDGCWLWTGAKTVAGYGTLHTTTGRQYAHRFSWLVNVGTDPSGLVICHRCDVPACVRPDHLFLGTQEDNVHDMLRKGRGSGKLTRAQADEIRHTYENGDASQYELARRYGVKQTSISAIVRRRTHRVA